MRSGRMITIVAVLCIVFAASGCGDDDAARPPIPSPIPGIDGDPAWSPDGQAIAFFHAGITRIDYETGHIAADPDSYGVWIVRPNGSDKQMLLRNAETPAWAPDGKWLCVVIAEQLWKVKADGDSLTQLTSHGSYFEPSWSPDGQRIASSTPLCDPIYPCGLWLTQASGAGSRWLLQGAGPDWSPDGESILYVGILDGKRAILRYDITSASSHMIYPIGDAHITSGPEYDPDGLRIAVGMDSHIWTMTSIGADAEELPSVQCYGSISWSPDGARIAYAPGDGIWLIDADGTNARQITFPPN